MKPSRRALAGAAGGALLVLIAMPQTRPGFRSAFRPKPSGGLASLLARPPLVRPTDRPSGAAYLHAGVARPALDEEERRTLVGITLEGARKEPGNAFWPLARFVLRNGEGPEARADWRTASRCELYDDFQNAALLGDRDRIAAEVGDIQAWMFASIAPRRSDAMIRKIKDTALATLQSLPEGRERTEFAYETIQNGRILRDWSRRLRLGFIAISMIEGTTYRNDMPTAVRDSPRRLWIAKGLLTRDVRKFKGEEDARLCDTQFNINDSWQAFSDVEDPVGRFRALAIVASVAATLPGGLLAGSLVGLLVWLFGRRIAKIAGTRNRFRGPGLTACSLGLVAAGFGLGFPLVGLAAGACALVPALAPERPRRFDGRSLGPLHGFVVGCLGFAILAGVALAVIARSLPGETLAAQGAVGAWLGDRNRLGSFVVVVLGASALVAPAWASVRRFATPAIAAKTYIELGRGVALVGVALSILASPLCFALDRRVGDVLGAIALNEPTYYKPYNQVQR